MTWDATTPAGTESVRNGDNRIRELKTDLATALTTEGIFPGPDTSAPKFRYKPPYDVAGGRPSASSDFIGRLFINITRACIQRDNGSSWDDVATMIPAGTVVPFFQAAAPTGWTKSTSNTDAVLRVTSGSGGGTGGTDSISSPPTHTHTITVNNEEAAIGSPSNTVSRTTTPTGATTAFSPKYVDVILCTKD